MTAATDVRPRIGVFLAERGGFKAADGGVDETDWMSDSEKICVSLFYGGLSVYEVQATRQGNNVLSVPFSLRVDSPDPLDRLGETLDGLGA